MRTVSIELPDVAARALDQASAATRLDPETLLAEGLRQLPCFQKALSEQPEVLLFSFQGSKMPVGGQHA